MKCPKCGGRTQSAGKTRHGKPRRKCYECKYQFSRTNGDALGGQTKKLTGDRSQVPPKSNGDALGGQHSSNDLGGQTSSNDLGGQTSDALDALGGQTEELTGDRCQVPPKSNDNALEGQTGVALDALGGQTEELTGDRSQVPPKSNGNALGGQHNDLGGQHNDLRGQHNDLGGQHNDLRGQHNDLGGQHSDLGGQTGVALDALGGQTEELTGNRCQVPPKSNGDGLGEQHNGLGGQQTNDTLDALGGQHSDNRYIKIQHYLEIHKNLKTKDYSETEIKKALKPGSGWIEEKWIEGKWGPYSYYRCRIGKKKITIYLGKSKP